MIRRFASIVYLLTGVLIGLGAFGHGSHAPQLGHALAASPTIDAATAAVIVAVWYFVSGCMLVFGATVIWTWWQARGGARDVFFPSDAIAVFYIVAGVATAIYTHMPFFWVFVVFGALLLIASVPLRRDSRR
ncbi:MAG: hypothetical protein ACREO6_09480 [Rudaea sp.]